MNPYPGQTGILSPKEAILLVQRLAALEKLNLFEHASQPAASSSSSAAGGAGGGAGGVSPLRKAWDSTLLSLVLRLATPPPEAQVRTTTVRCFVTFGPTAYLLLALWLCPVLGALDFAFYEDCPQAA